MSKDGHRYEGPFVHGRLVGRGTVTYRNGDRYDGLLDGFARHGEGTCAYTVGHAIYVGGSVKEGIFARGLLHAVEPACPRVDLGVRLPPPRPRRPMRRESGSGRRCPLTIECTIEYTVPP